jgi:hypothetical protein
VRDGSAVAEPEPCASCRAVPERDHLGLLHDWHEEGCEWVEELERGLGER